MLNNPLFEAVPIRIPLSPPKLRNLSVAEFLFNMNQAPCQPSRQGACPGSCSPRPNPFAGPARSVGSLRPRSILPNVRAAAWPVLEFAC